MKKLMFAAVAGFAMTGFSIESANIVGYNQGETAGVKHYSGGAMFVPMGEATSTLLTDWTAEGMDAGMDKIQFLKVTTAAKDKAYTYVDTQFIIDEFEPEDEEELAEYIELYLGWWDAGYWGKKGHRITKENDVEVPVGKGFLTLCPSGNDIAFKYCGECPKDATYVQFTGKHPMVCNYIPRTIDLTEMTALGMDAGMDKLQRLKPETAAKLEAYTYVDTQFIIDEFEPEDEEELAEYIELYLGWWDAGYWGKKGHRIEEGAKTLLGGEALLGLIPSENTVNYWFPESIPTVEE